MRLVERDYEILREVDRWPCVLSRQIRLLVGFPSQSPCDRRIRLLMEAGYLERKRYLYGVPGLLSLTYQGRILIGVSKNGEKPRLEQINHDMAVLDTAIYFMLKYGVEKSGVLSEKQLHQIDGFGNRRHRPDFSFDKDGKSCCVEIELSIKSKERLLKNLKDNFDKYDLQYWVVPKGRTRISTLIKANENDYPNIKLIQYEEVESYVRTYGKSES